jgi:hypothetical protein
MENTTAMSTLARNVAQALLAFADEIDGTSTAQVPDDALPLSPTQTLGLGHRQQQVLDQLKTAGGDGLRTGVIAAAVGMDHPNTLLTLRALEKRGLAELVPGVCPQHWRLKV